MSTSTRLGLLINPTAGHGRGAEVGQRVRAEMVRRGLAVVDLSRPTVKEAVAETLRRREEYDALIVVGGDGMAHMGINLTAGTGIPLGVIPSGSGNDFARHLGLPLHREAKAIDLILEALRGGPIALDVARITPLHDRPPLQENPYPQPYRYAGCVVSAGFDSVVNARANTYAWPRGILRYVRGVFHELPRFRPYPYRVTIDGEHLTLRGTLVAVANAPSFGGGMKIAPGANVQSGTLRTVLAGAVSRLALLRLFPLVYSGRHVSHSAVDVRDGRAITISSTGEQEIPPIFADGEYVGEGPVRIEVETGALQMLCPRLEA